MNRFNVVVSTVLTLLCFCLPSFSQTDAEISAEQLASYQASLADDPLLKASKNAVSNNDIKKLVVNREHLGKTDEHFAAKVNTSGITDQKSSGRCWLFTSLNVLRPKVMETFNLNSFEFSENYLFFYDQLEKSNLFLESVIETAPLPMTEKQVEWLFKNPIGDGGVWNMATALIEKYGVVPAEVMPEAYHSENTRTMNRLIKRKLREQGLRLRDAYEQGATTVQLRTQKDSMLSDIFRMLVIHLGEPPQQFTWRYKDKDGNVCEAKSYTPQGFYKTAVGVDLNDYVMMMNDPTRDFYKLYEIKWDRNMVNKPNWTYVNLPVEDLKTCAKTSIVNNEAMYFSCDVGKQLDRTAGIISLENYDYESIYGVTFGMTKKDRILSFDSGSTHGMALVGVDTTDSGETVKWLLENSWGKDSGHNGYLLMTDGWFDEYSFRLVVKRDFVPARILDILEQTPVMLEPWDPMFLPFDDQ